MPKNKFENPMLDSASVNFGLLHSDIIKWCKDNNTTMIDMSVNKLYRSDCYLSARLSEKRMALNTLIGICGIIGQPMKRYEVVVVPPKKEELKQEVQTGGEPTETAVTAEWDCRVSVQPAFGIVSFIILHNGEEFTIGHAKINGKTDVEIAKAISYAAHICYKNIEQGDFINRIAASDPTALDRNPFNSQVPFKEYLRPFVGEKSARGELARFAVANYAMFPTWGEKNMRHYMMASCASKQVVDGFDEEFPKYRKWAARG